MDIDHILVKGCPLCDIFLEPEKNIHTTLYYPSIEDIPESDFVILDCDTCKIPMVVIRDHVTNPSKQVFGNILRVCRNQFGTPIQLRCRPNKIRDHYHCHIIKKKDYR